MSTKASVIIQFFSFSVKVEGIVKISELCVTTTSRGSPGKASLAVEASSNFRLREPPRAFEGMLTTSGNTPGLHVGACRCLEMETLKI